MVEGRHERGFRMKRDRLGLFYFATLATFLHAGLIFANGSHSKDCQTGVFLSDFGVRALPSGQRTEQLYYPSVLWDAGTQMRDPYPTPSDEVIGFDGGYAVALLDATRTRMMGGSSSDFWFYYLEAVLPGGRGAVMNPPKGLSFSGLHKVDERTFQVVLGQRRGGAVQAPQNLRIITFSFTDDPQAPFQLEKSEPYK